LKLPKEYLLSDLLSHNVRGSMTLSYGAGESVWMHPPVHRILGWSSKPSNFDLKRNVWKLNQIRQIIDNDIFVRGEPSISDLATLNRFPSLLFANLINKKGSKIGFIADFVFDFKTGNIKYYMVSRSNPKIPGSSRWKLEINKIIDQQPGLVFTSFNVLDDLLLMKSSLKNEFFKKGKKIFNRFDNFKNIASNRFEDWLDEDDSDDMYQKKNNDYVPYDDSQEIDNNNFYSDNINFKSSQKKKEDDPWI
tara:strand:- start:2877 stop:3623 length:747 start_codon:yes stop_codon:yes gene_type:complete